MKKFLRVFTVVLVFTLITFTLASCSLYNNNNNNNNNENNSDENSSSNNNLEENENNSSDNTKTEDIPELASKWSEFEEHHSETITWFEQGWTGMEEELDIITPEIERRTNFHLGYEPMTVPTGDDYTQKLNLMVASDEVPDIFFGGIDSYTRTIYSKLGESGKIWDLTEIIKDYENLYDLVYPELNLYQTKENKNYFVPTQTGKGNEVLKEPPHGLMVRKDFLDQLNMDYPSNTDELRVYLERCKEEITVNGEKVNGLVIGENLSGLEQLYQPFLPLIGEHESYTLPFDPNDDYKVKNYLYTDSPELLEAAKYIQGLVADGLIDNEALTIKQAQFQEKVSSGMASAITASWWDMNTFSDNARQIVPELIYVAPPPMYNSDEIAESRNKKWTNWVGCWSSLIISKEIKEDAVRHLLAVMDYLVTEEGQLLVQAGIEDETYQWNEDGKYEFTEEFIEKTNDLDWNKAAAYGVFYYSQLVFNVPAIADLQTTPPTLLREDNRLGWENQKVIREQYDKDMKPTKDYYFVPGEIENQKFPAIKDASLEFWAKILAAESEDEVEILVEEWAKTCDKLGINEIIAEREEFMENLEIE